MVLGQDERDVDFLKVKKRVSMSIINGKDLSFLNDFRAKGDLLCLEEKFRDSTLGSTCAVATFSRPDHSVTCSNCCYTPASNVATLQGRSQWLQASQNPISHKSRHVESLTWCDGHYVFFYYFRIFFSLRYGTFKKIVVSLEFHSTTSERPTKNFEMVPVDLQWRNNTHARTHTHTHGDA